MAKKNAADNNIFETSTNTDTVNDSNTPDTNVMEDDFPFNSPAKDADAPPIIPVTENDIFFAQLPKDTYPCRITSVRERKNDDTGAVSLVVQLTIIGGKGDGKILYKTYNNYEDDRNYRSTKTFLELAQVTKLMERIKAEKRFDLSWLIGKMVMVNAGYNPETGYTNVNYMKSYSQSAQNVMSASENPWS